MRRRPVHRRLPTALPLRPRPRPIRPAARSTRKRRRLLLRQPSNIIGITPRPLHGGRGVFFGAKYGGHMDLIVAMKALILGVVEGLTEFLPVSSTGHLIVVGSLLDWNDEKGELFEIVIQFAAILAVCWQYRQRLWTVATTLPRDPKSQRFTLNLVLAFLPAAVLGVLLIAKIKQYLFAPVPVATAFIVGGLLILWIESRKRTPHVATVDDIRPADATWIGFAQALS